MSDCTVVGIDLGTTNSVVGIWRKKRVEILANAEGFRITPSVVSFTEDSTLVGNAASRKMVTNPENTVYDMKRLKGKKFNDEHVQKHMKYWPFKVQSDGAGRPIVDVMSQGNRITQRPVDISAKVLNKMRSTAERVVQRDISKAVITVPAYFSQSQRTETIEAARLAGLEVLELITEPAAAAYAYGFDSHRYDNYKVLVFDLGGGTFDVSVIEVADGKFAVKAIGGDTNLGGRDFDNALLDNCERKIFEQYGKDCRGNKKLRQKLLAMCVDLKIALSSSTEESIYLGDLFADLEEEIYISRANLEAYCAELISKTVLITQQTLQQAKLNPSDITEILLVGGSSRIPVITKLLSEQFPGKKLNNSINVDEAVAYGAAIRAAQLCEATKVEAPNMFLIEATPLSVGIMIDGGRYRPLIERNSKFPTRVESDFFTTVNDQQSMRFCIYEGERKLVQHNNYLGKFVIAGLTPGAAEAVSGLKAKSFLGLVEKARNLPKFESKKCFRLALELDKNGILHASATHKDTKATMELEFKDIHVAESQTIEEMLRDAKIFEEQDQIEYDRIAAHTALEIAIRKVRYEVENTELPVLDKLNKETHCRNYENWLKQNENALAHTYRYQLDAFKTACNGQKGSSRLRKF